MNVSIKKIFILLISCLLLFPTGCSNISKNDIDEIVIRIGEYTVSQQEYENLLKKTMTIYDGLSHEEVVLFLLDNYISIGLLVESAKKMNYNQRQDFVQKDFIYKKQLAVKNNKYLRANTNKTFLADNRIIEKMLHNEMKIDYIRIPIEHKELSKQIYEYLIYKTTISNMLKNPKRAMWDDAGLSFYEAISLNQAILTDKVTRKIMAMKEDEVKIVKTKSAHYIVRLLQSVKYPVTDMLDSKPVLLNQLMARNLENGDIVFDPYRLKKSIQYDNTLLSKIDFSITPFHSDSDYVAKICNRFISENEIKAEISELPVKIQCLFVNKSTRIKAVATLILLNYYHEEEVEKSFNNNSNIRNVQQNRASDKIADWLQPDKIIGYDQLSLDFRKIEKMEIAKTNIHDDQILAYSGHWSITVKDFREELNKLTPITRFELANKNLFRETIEYLAKKDIDTDNSKLVINSNFFESIDIMGNSYDQLSYVFDENAIVGSLESIDISVGELRELFTELSEVKKNKFLNSTTKKESFYEIITEKFWLSLYDRNLIEDNPELKKRISNYQNKLLIELLYEHGLQVDIPQIDDEGLSYKMQQSVKSMNESKLLSYIQAILQDYPIQVNSDYFQKNLNLDVETSKYHKVIIKNIN